MEKKGIVPKGKGCMSKIFQYGLYTIRSFPRQTHSDTWALDITISWVHDEIETMRSFSSAVPPYYTEEEADLHGIAFGQLISDGKIQGVSLN